MLTRKVMLTCVLSLLTLYLAVGFPANSQTKGRSPDGQLPPATPQPARPFSGELAKQGKLELNVERRHHTATALADGRVLIVGGDNSDGAVGQAELLDPAAYRLVTAGRLLTPRAKHAASLLANGKVLISGGSNSQDALDSTEVFDPKTGAFFAGPRLQRARAGHSATVLADGSVLIAGGQGEDSAEIFNPATNRTVLLNGKLTAARGGHGAVRLNDGRVLLAGGEAGNGHNLETAEIFDPGTGGFSAVSRMMIPRAHPALRVLPNGQVQVIGGDADGTMEIFDPASGRFAALTHLAPTADVFSPSEMLGAKTRGAFFDAASYRNAKIKRPVSDGFKAAFGAFERQEAGRANYAAAEIPGRHLAVVAGGVDDRKNFVRSVLLLPSSQAAIFTGQAQYRPGQAPVIAGTGWQPGETVTIIRQEANLGHQRKTLQAVADAQGSFTCAELKAADHQPWINYTLTASGQSSKQIAQTVYQDLPPAGRELESLPTRLVFDLPITNRDGSVETGTLTLKWTNTAPVRANATAATCTVPDGNDFSFDADFSNILNKPCLGIDGNPCGAFGDVQLKDACLAFSGSVRAEICLLCPDGNGGVVTPYAKLSVEENFKTQARIAFDLNDDFNLPVFNLPIPGLSTAIAIPGLEEVFSATLGLTVRARIEATVTTPAAFETTFDLAQGAEVGFDTRQNPAFFNRETTTPGAGGDITLTKLGEASARFKLGPNLGIIIHTGPIAVVDFGLGVLGYVEPSVIEPKDTLDCKAGKLDLFAGVDGDANAKFFPLFNESVALDFFRQHIDGFPKDFAIVDSAPPGITNLGNIVRTVDAGQCSAVVTFNPTITDDCSGVDLSTLSISQASGTAFPLGTTTVNVSVRDRKGNLATASFNVTVNCPPIALPASLPGGTAASPYDQSVAATPATHTYGYSVTAGALPPGLSLNASTGQITGTPAQSGNFNFTVAATICGGSCLGAQSYQVTIACPAITFPQTFLFPGVVNQPYDQPITVSPAGSYVYSLESGSLPDGLSLGADGRITGTPTTGGNATFTVKAVGFGGCQGTKQFTLSVACIGFEVILEAAENAVAGIAYEAVFKVKQGSTVLTDDYTFTVFTGTLPPGLTLHPDGRLTGVPSQVGNFISLGVMATGTELCAAVGFTNYTVNCPTTPAVLSPATLPDGRAFVPYDQMLMPSLGALPYNFQVTDGGLPAGLTLTPEGRLFGTPTQAGLFSFTITATDTAGCQAMRQYNSVRMFCPLLIFPQPTQGASYVLPNGEFGVPYEQMIAVSSPAGFAYSYSADPGTLPAGLTLSADGRLSGTPMQAGNFAISISASTNDFGGSCTGGSFFLLSIPCPAITVPALPNAILTAPYDQTLAPLPAAAGPYAYDNVIGTPPPGLTFDVTTGRLFGTPAQTGTFSFSVRVKGFNNFCLSNQTITLTVECPTVTASPLPGGTATVAYNQTITSSPSGSYTFTHSAGTLPPGLSFASGNISGTPTQAGTFSFNVTATATSGALSSCTRELTYSITIGCPAISLSTLPGGTASVAYNQTVTALPAGGNYSFALTGGALPPGLSLSATGNLSGTPSQAGTFTFTVTATGFGSCPKAQEYTVTIACPNITLSSLTGGTAGATYNQTVTALPAGGNYSFAVTSGSLPPGLNFNNGALTGTPSQAGSFTFTITATGFGSCPKAQEYTMTIACPNITLSSLPGGTAGAAYNHTITALPAGGNYSFAVTEGSLPPGLNFNNGALTGAPTQLGSYSFTVTATGFGNCTGARSYTIVIACPTIALTPATLPNATVNSAYNQTLTATPVGNSYSYAVTSGLLPPGLTLNSNGSFSGAPAQSGTFNFRVTASAFGSCSGFQDYQLLVACSSVTINPANLPDGAVGAAYDQTIAAAPAGTYDYRVSSGALPGGLSLDATTGRLSGTPAAGGTFTFTLTATSGDCLGGRSYTINIGCAAMTITTPPLAAATAGNAYSQSLSVAPSGSYTFSLAQGNLPSGLTLHPQTGVISGLPSVTGTVSFIVKAQATNGCSVTQSYTLAVNCPAVVLSPASLPNGETAAAYNQMLSATPAGGNYSFTVTGGALPTGLSLNPATGALTGTPTANGGYNFTITATGFGGCTGSQAYSITIGSGGCSTITLADLPAGQPGQLYNHSVAATPQGSYSYAMTSGSLPPGLTLYGSLGMIFGYPATAGTFNFTLTGTSSNNCSGSKQYSLTIGGAAVTSLVFGDFDGDGKADLSVWRGQAGDWLTVASGDGQLKTERWGSTVAPYFDVMTPGDYDGDGRMDLAVFRRQTGQWLIKGSRDGAVTAKVWGVATDVPVPGDYDGDGRTDIAVWRGAETNWYILRSSDEQTESISWGTSRAPYRDVPVAADFDGDGKTDIAVFRQSNGHWYIRQSSDGAVIDKAWGLGSDVPVAADYDGDGKADIAVWRGADSNWYVLQTSDGAVQSISWGSSSAGDVPVPGDFDGDGKADVAVWRAWEGRWSARLSRDNSVLTRTHGQQGDAPALSRTRP